jgi:hypothetical protein
MGRKGAANQRQYRPDRRIVAQRGEARHLLRQRNALAPIASLSADVLAEVFTILQYMVYGVSKSEAPTFWRALTHTCQAWRWWPSSALACGPSSTLIEVMSHGHSS